MNMTAKMHNDLRFYTLKITETEQEAERVVKLFSKKFNDLGKYDQMDMSLTIELDGWEMAFDKLNVFE